MKGNPELENSYCDRNKATAFIGTPSTVSARRSIEFQLAEAVLGAPIILAARILGYLHAGWRPGKESRSLHRKQSGEGKIVSRGEGVAFQQRKISG